MNTKEYFLSPETNNSDLSYFTRYGARKFKYEKDKLQDENIVAEKVKSLRDGRAFHTLVLEPDIFAIDYIPLEITTPGSPQQKTFCEQFANLTMQGKEEDEALAIAYFGSYVEKDIIKATKKALQLREDLSTYIEWLKLKDSEKIVLTKSVYKNIQGARETLRDDPVTKELLFRESSNRYDTFNEKAILWNVLWSSVGLKSKLDRIIVDHDKKTIINAELKSTKNATKKSFLSDLYYYQYHKQESFYENAIANWAYTFYGGRIFSVQTKIIACELEPPYNHNVFDLHESIISEGKKIWEEQLVNLSWHIENDIWIDKEYYEYESIVLKTRETEDEKQTIAEEQI